MAIRYALVVGMLLVITAGIAGAEGAGMRTTVQDNLIIINNAEQTLGLNRSEPFFDYHTPNLKQTYYLETDFTYGLTSGERKYYKPEIVESKDRIKVAQKYAMSSGNTVTVTVVAVDGIPGFTIRTSLRNSLRDSVIGLRWTNRLNVNPTFTGSLDGKSYKDYDEIGKDNFVYIDECKWSVFGYGDSKIFIMTGGGVSKQWSWYLQIHPMPSRIYVPKGKIFDHSFSFSQVNDASECAAIYSKIAKSRINNVQTKIYPLSNIDYGSPAPADALKLKTYSQSNYFDILVNDPGQWVQDVGLWFSDHPLPDNIKILRKENPKAKMLAYINWMEIYSKTHAQEIGDMPFYEFHAKKAGFEALNIDEHPNWFAYDAAGNIKRSGYRPQSCFYICMHQEDLHEAVRNAVKIVMDSGLDGIFVDNAFPLDECYGAILGKHKHPDTYKSNVDAYLYTLKIAYDTVKSYGKDKIVFTNMGPFSYFTDRWKYMDMQMWESAISTAEHSVGIRASRDLVYQGKMAKQAVKHGKLPTIFDYYSAMPNDKKVRLALFSYAYCKLYGILWSDHRTLFEEKHQLANDTARELYNTDLGKPKTEETGSGLAYYRCFEKGFVAVNMSRFISKTVIVPAKNLDIVELSTHTRLQPVNGKIKISLEPMQGRVFVYR